MYIVYSPARHLSPKVRTFVDHAVAYLQRDWPRKERP